MRKIETEETREKRRKRNTAIVSFVMLGILLLGTVGFAFSFGGGQNNEVVDVGTGAPPGKWGVTVGDRTVYLSNSPESSMEVDVNIERNLESYLGKGVYVSSNDSLILGEIGSSLGLYSGRIQRACYGECEEDLPEKSCEDNVIVVQDNEDKRVYQEDNCVFINGGLKEVDAFLYSIFGVI